LLHLLFVLLTGIVRDGVRLQVVRGLMLWRLVPWRLLLRLVVCLLRCKYLLEERLFLCLLDLTILLLILLRHRALRLLRCKLLRLLRCKYFLGLKDWLVVLLIRHALRLRELPRAHWSLNGLRCNVLDFYTYRGLASSRRRVAGLPQGRQRIVEDCRHDCRHDVSLTTHG